MATKQLQKGAARGRPRRGDAERKIFAAALKLFEAKGFGATAVPEIAEEAGVGTGTIYRHFDGKEALLNALFRHWKGRFNDDVLAPLPAGIDARGAFATYWQRIARWIAAHPEEARFLDLHQHGALLDAESRKVEEVYVEAATAFVAFGTAEGALRPLAPMLVVSLVWGAALGLMKFTGENRIDLDRDTVKAAEDALWRAIAVEEKESIS